MRSQPRPVTVQITIMADADATVAELVSSGPDGMTVTASAKREPGDRSDPAIGTDLATARVLAKAARKLERRARGRVKHADDVKTARQAARERGVLARERETREKMLRDLTGADEVIRQGSPAAGEVKTTIRPRHARRG